jgi:hypothetical protein
LAKRSHLSSLFYYISASPPHSYRVACQTSNPFISSELLCFHLGVIGPSHSDSCLLLYSSTLSTSQFLPNPPNRSPFHFIILVRILSAKVRGQTADGFLIRLTCVGVVLHRFGCRVAIVHHRHVHPA